MNAKDSSKSNEQIVFEGKLAEMEKEWEQLEGIDYTLRFELKDGVVASLPFGPRITLDLAKLSSWFPGRTLTEIELEVEAFWSNHPHLDEEQAEKVRLRLESKIERWKERVELVQKSRNGIQVADSLQYAEDRVFKLRVRLFEIESFLDWEAGTEAISIPDKTRRAAREACPILKGFPTPTTPTSFFRCLDQEKVVTKSSGQPAKSNYCRKWLAKQNPYYEKAKVDNWQHLRKAIERAASS